MEIDLVLIEYPHSSGRSGKENFDGTSIRGLAGFLGLRHLDAMIGQRCEC